VQGVEHVDAVGPVIAGDSFGASGGGGSYITDITLITGIASGVTQLQAVSGFQSGDGQVVMTAIPELATYAALLGLGALGCAAHRRRRRQAA